MKKLTAKDMKMGSFYRCREKGKTATFDILVSLNDGSVNCYDYEYKRGIRFEYDNFDTMYEVLCKIKLSEVNI